MELDALLLTLLHRLKTLQLSGAFLHELPTSWQGLTNLNELALTLSPMFRPPSHSWPLLQLTKLHLTVHTSINMPHLVVCCADSIPNLTSLHIEIACGGMSIPRFTMQALKS